MQRALNAIAMRTVWGTFAIVTRVCGKKDPYIHQKSNTSVSGAADASPSKQQARGPLHILYPRLVRAMMKCVHVYYTRVMYAKIPIKIDSLFTCLHLSVLNYVALSLATLARPDYSQKVVIF